MDLHLRLILILSSVICFIFIIRKIKKSKMRIDDAIFWIVTSGLFLFMAIFPKAPIYFADLIGIESPANLVFLSVVGLMFIKLFSLSALLSAEVEKKNQLIQYIALLEKNRQDKID
jgi:hypothetical protein